MSSAGLGSDAVSSSVSTTVTGLLMEVSDSGWKAAEERGCASDASLLCSLSVVMAWMLSGSKSGGNYMDASRRAPSASSSSMIS